jgi:Asp-tRNA(Asn)/Glu-tRNA(Gln) amidotransferase A subunit family amidase
MGAADLTGVAATVLADLVARGEASVEEVVAAHLARIADVDGPLGAVVALDPERALRDARAADAAAARGDPRGPLHGVPFTAKDNVAATGLVMAIGVPERADVVPEADATSVARLREAGGILLGKTNRPPWGGGIEAVARPWRDDVALAAALHLERELGGYRPPALATAAR